MQPIHASKLMAKDDYKFKFYERINPFTKRKEYQTLMMGTVDGKDVTYRTSFQRSKQMAKDEINRAIGAISASKDNRAVTVKQNYGTTKTQINPSQSVASVLSTGGKITPPSTYNKITYEGGMKATQPFSQTGIRKGEKIFSTPANMANVDNYDPFLDENKKTIMSGKLIK